jgi:hypothetical protein
MIELKKLTLKVPDVGFQYTGQSIEELETILEAYGVNPMDGMKLVTENENGTLRINHWSCSEVWLEFGDWIVLDDPRSDVSGIPNIIGASAIEKFYNVE